MYRKGRDMDSKNDRPAVIDGKLVRFTSPVKVDDGLTQAGWDATRCDECGENSEGCYCEQADMLDNYLFGQ